ncbi:MAG: tRNA lysidine(34) synthetase TilS [Marinosulfonomonas sp.]
MSAKDPVLEQLPGALLEKYPSDPIGIAVSGGGDSTALLHVMADWAAEKGTTVQAITVDHGLRPEAAQEAEQVAKICADLGVKHAVAKWENWDGHGNLQDQARQARYGLIADWASAEGIDVIALGHTADDQAETFLMRLARQAGIDGLAGMAAERRAYGKTWIRPLLQLRRDDLRASLRRRKIAWVDDPSNEDEKYDRIKLRKMMPVLSELGLGVEGLSAVAAQLAEARQALELQTQVAAQTAVRIEAGDVLLEWDQIAQLPDEISRRILVHSLKWVASAGYSPRGRAIQELKNTINLQENATLHGCRVLAKGSTVRITREAQSVKGVQARIGEVWDQRWRVSGPDDAGYHIAILGENGLGLCPDWRETGLARASLLASPAVWNGDELVAAPLAGLTRGWQAELVKGENDFYMSIISH